MTTITPKGISKITILALVVLCSSCSELEGKIEKRNSNKLYLVNNSKTKEFRFTVKKTKITNDSIFEYSTSQSQLAPGDELYLGNENEVSEKQYPTIEKKMLKTYEIVGEDYFEETKTINGIRYYKDDNGDWQQIPKFDPNKKYESVDELPDLNKGKKITVTFDDELLPIPPSRLKDTILNGKKYKYLYTSENVKDSLHPFRQTHYKYIYVVTGQVEIKNDKSKLNR